MDELRLAAERGEHMTEGEISINDQDGVLLVTVEEGNCMGLWKALEPRVKAGDKAVVLDLAGVNYLNSMAIAAIISLRNKIQAAGGKLMLADLHEQIATIFRILKLERLFDLTMSRNAALNAARA